MEILSTPMTSDRSPGWRSNQTNAMPETSLMFQALFCFSRLRRTRCIHLESLLEAHFTVVSHDLNEGFSRFKRDFIPFLIQISRHSLFIRSFPGSFPHDSVNEVLRLS